MDKKQAKFILASFRPEGADAHDDTFTEALQLAAEDRDLGEWLANERHMDAEFTATLNEIVIPDDLRLHILAVMRGESINDPEEESLMDEMFSDALMALEPPAELKGQILAAMDVQQKELEGNVVSIQESTGAAKKKSGWFNMKGMMSVAAALALGGFLALQVGSLKSDGVMSSQTVQLHTSDIFSASFELDVKESSPEKIKTWLTSRDLPLPSNLPTQLASMERIGCKELSLPETQRGSLICYKGNEGEMIHMIVVKNEMVKDENIPSVDEVSKGDCYFCPKTKWDVARWKDDQNTYIMMSKPKAGEKNTIMRYF